MNIMDDLDAELPDFLPKWPPDDPGENLPVDEEGIWQFTDEPHEDLAGGAPERLDDVEDGFEQDGGLGKQDCIDGQHTQAVSPSLITSGTRR